MIEDSFTKKKFEEIGARLRKQEDEADRLNLALVRVSKRRVLVVRFRGADEGIWRTEVVHGPATEGACMEFVESERKKQQGPEK